MSDVLRERNKALEAKCALLSASLKKADAENERLRAHAVSRLRALASRPALIGAMCALVDLANELERL